MSEDLIANRLEALEKRVAALEADRDKVSQFPTKETVRYSINPPDLSYLPYAGFLPGHLHLHTKIDEFKTWCKSVLERVHS